MKAFPWVYFLCNPIIMKGLLTAWGPSLLSPLVLVDPGKLDINLLSGIPRNVADSENSSENNPYILMLLSWTLTSVGRAYGVLTVTIRGNTPESKSQYEGEWLLAVFVTAVSVCPLRWPPAMVHHSAGVSEAPAASAYWEGGMEGYLFFPCL